MFGWLKGDRRSKHLMTVLQSMEGIADENARVYPGQARLVGTRPTSIGLFRVRFFGCLFPAYAYVMRWPDHDPVEFFGAATGVAMKGVPEQDFAATRKTASSLYMGMLKAHFTAMQEELEAGPSGPDEMTGGFQKLVDLYLDVFKDEIQRTPAVKTRLLPAATSGVFGQLRVTIQLMQHMS